jgi:outer membrane receptor protein involved in Fe transport
MGCESRVQRAGRALSARPVQRPRAQQSECADIADDPHRTAADAGRRTQRRGQADGHAQHGRRVQLTDAFFRDSTSGTVVAGNKVGNVPEHAASLWTRYDPVEQFGVGLGVIYQGKRFASTDNLVSMDAYTRVDGALYYNLTQEVALQLNVENILGERYFLYANSNTNITPGSPTAIKGGVNVRF